MAGKLVLAGRKGLYWFQDGSDTTDYANGTQLVNADDGSFNVTTETVVDLTTTGNTIIGNSVTDTLSITSVESHGVTGTHLNNATSNGSQLAVFADTTATAAGRMNTILCESYVGATGQQGVYAIRGLGGVKTGITLGGAAQTFVAGVQGKLQGAGTFGTGAGAGTYCSAVLAQVGTGGTYAADAQVYGLWVDNQRATGGEGLFHMVNITNNGGVVDNVFKIYGGNQIATFADIETAGGGMVVSFAGNVTNQVKALHVKIEGVNYYIPLQNATS